MSDQLHFSFTSHPSNVLFGVGRAKQLRQIVKDFDGTRIFFVTSESGVKRHSDLLDSLSDFAPKVFDQVQPHCPQEVVDDAIKAYSEHGADLVVAIGGGSSLGIGKILKAEHGAKFIAVPTTYSGSEMTPIYGRKLKGAKRTKVDRAAIPDAVIYDPVLTLRLPEKVSAATGMNSLAHAVEALYPIEPNPIAFDLAKQAIKLHAKALPIIAREPRDISARIDALYAGFLGGLLVSMVGVALHHALGHVVGGLFDMEHGDYNSAILPHVIAYNGPRATAAADAIATSLCVSDASRGVYDLASSIGAPSSLESLGMPACGVAPAVDAILAKNPRNPRELTRSHMTKMIERIHQGVRPSMGDFPV